MKNYLLTIQYDGTRYRGWQVQGNTEQTIQGKLQAVLSQLDHSEVEVHGSGRTDAGVHAIAQTASVKLQTEPACDYLVEYCAQYLPKDIAVIRCEYAPERFHARLNCKEKTYIYRIWNCKTPNVFERNYMLQIAEPLNIEEMRKAAAFLVGTHDYRSFCGLKRFKKSTVRTIFEISITQISSEVRINYRGTGFLNQMVRILTGTLVEVGLGLRSAESMNSILDMRSRDAAGKTMPAQGLSLLHTSYD